MAEAKEEHREVAHPRFDGRVVVVALVIGSFPPAAEAAAPIAPGSPMSTRTRAVSA